MMPRSPLRRLLRNPSALIALLLLATMATMALSAPYLYLDDPMSIVARPYLWPGQNPDYWLGTDNLGRDLTAQAFYGARVSLWIGIVAALICLTIGTVIGALGGYFGGRTDRALTRVTEVVQTMPSFLFLIVIVAIFQPSVTSITVGIGLVSWPTIARLVRAEFRTIKECEFVLAARVLGYSDLRIMLRMIAPNALSPLLVTASVIVATAILNESALSFLGLGDPNAVSWGTMIGNGRAVIRTAWYLSAIPGALIVLTVLAINLLGEAVNDAVNPNL